MIASGDLFQLMLDLYQTWGVHYVKMSDLHTEFTQVDQGFRDRIELHAWYERLIRRIEQDMPHGTLVMYQDELEMSYAFFRVPEALTAECGCRYLAIGPVLFCQPTREHIVAIIERIGGSADYLREFMEFYNQTFLFTSSERDWLVTLLFYLRRICGDTDVDFVQVVESEEGFVADEDYHIPMDPDTALSVVEDRYRAENAMIYAIASGNYDESLMRLHAFLQYRLSPRQADPVRDRKNIMFVFNTLMRKAAEHGGVHPLHIDNLSRQFALEIEKTASVEALDQLQVVMVRKYCLLVQNYARNDYPTLVQNCMNAIDFYYNSDLSLARLARICSVSESHLSSAFKKATGTTVTDYINQTRVHQALLLLNSTSLPIGEIASRCGFYDANYFSRIFRRLQGMSPREYRAAIRA